MYDQEKRGIGQWVNWDFSYSYEQCHLQDETEGKPLNRKANASLLSTRFG